MPIYWYIPYDVCMPAHFKKLYIYSLRLYMHEKFLVFIGKKCSNKMKYKYSIMQGAFFFRLND